MKKALVFLLTLCMALGLCAVPALAEEPAVSPAAEAAQADAVPAPETAEEPLIEAEESAQRKTYLGVSVYDGFRVGVLVADVQPDGPAAKAGIRPDDVLVSLNGEAVADSDALMKAAEKLEAGAPVELSFLRKGSLCAVSLQPGDSDELGLSVYEGSAPAGTNIVEVVPDGPAARAGLLPDDVIVGFGGRTIVFTDDLIEAVQTYAPEDAVEIELLRDGGRYTVIAVLGELLPEEPEKDAAPAPEEAAAPALTVSDLPVSVEVREGSSGALLTVAAQGALDEDVSFIWYKLGKDGISYPMDSFFLPKPELLGLSVENSYDAEKDVYLSTLCANEITAAAEGTYFCRVTDVNCAELDSSSTVLSVR